MPDFKKYFIISAPPEEVFSALTFEPTIELWTGSPAKFKLEENAEFTLWDESIVGKIVRFEVGKLLEQEWYFGELAAPSIVTLKLHPDKKGTSIELVHTNIPSEAFDDIKDGWIHQFMKDLREFYQD